MNFLNLHLLTIFHTVFKKIHYIENYLAKLYFPAFFSHFQIRDFNID